MNNRSLNHFEPIGRRPILPSFGFDFSFSRKKKDTKASTSRSIVNDCDVESLSSASIDLELEQEVEDELKSRKLRKKVKSTATGSKESKRSRLVISPGGENNGCDSDVLVVSSDPPSPAKRKAKKQRVKQRIPAVIGDSDSNESGFSKLPFPCHEPISINTSPSSELSERDEFANKVHVQSKIHRGVGGNDAPMSPARMAACTPPVRHIIRSSSSCRIPTIAPLKPIPSSTPVLETMPIHEKKSILKSRNKKRKQIQSLDENTATHDSSLSASIKTSFRLLDTGSRKNSISSDKPSENSLNKFKLVSDIPTSYQSTPRKNDAQPQPTSENDTSMKKAINLKKKLKLAATVKDSKRRRRVITSDSENDDKSDSDVPSNPPSPAKPHSKKQRVKQRISVVNDNSDKNDCGVSEISPPSPSHEHTPIFTLPCPERSDKEVLTGNGQNKLHRLIGTMSPPPCKGVSTAPLQQVPSSRTSSVSPLKPMPLSKKKAVLKTGNKKPRQIQPTDEITLSVDSTISANNKIGTGLLDTDNRNKDSMPSNESSANSLNKCKLVSEVPTTSHSHSTPGKNNAHVKKENVTSIKRESSRSSVVVNSNSSEEEEHRMVVGLVIEEKAQEYFKLQNANTTNVIEVPVELLDNCAGTLKPDCLVRDGVDVYPGIKRLANTIRPNVGLGYIEIQAKTVLPFEMFPDRTIIFVVIKGLVTVKSAASFYRQPWSKDTTYMYGQTFGVGRSIIIEKNTVYSFENWEDEPVLMSCCDILDRCSTVDDPITSTKCEDGENPINATSDATQFN